MLPCLQCLDDYIRLFVVIYAVEWLSYLREGLEAAHLDSLTWICLHHDSLTVVLHPLDFAFVYSTDEGITAAQLTLLD